MFKSLVVTYFNVDIYDILIIQAPNGDLLSLKIEEYEPEQRTKAPEYFQDDENIH